MSRSRRFAFMRSRIVCAALAAATVIAADTALLSGQSQEPPACSQPPRTCPSHTAWGGNTRLSVVTEGSGPSRTCRFLEPNLPPLETFSSFDATWNLCNACDQDVVIVLDTWDQPGWAQRFMFFRPRQPDAQGVLTSDVIKCNSEEWIDAVQAKDPGESGFRATYKARLRLASAPAFIDTIDPELQIKRGGGIVRRDLIAIATGLSLLVGAALGYWWARRRRG